MDTARKEAIIRALVALVVAIIAGVTGIEVFV